MTFMVFKNKDQLFFSRSFNLFFKFFHVIIFKLYIFGKNNTEVMYSFHIKRHMMLICPRTNDDNPDRLVKGVSSMFLHCKVATFLLSIIKYLLE